MLTHLHHTVGLFMCSKPVWVFNRVFLPVRSVIPVTRRNLNTAKNDKASLTGVKGYTIGHRKGECEKENVCIHDKVFFARWKQLFRSVTKAFSPMTKVTNSFLMTIKESNLFAINDKNCSMYGNAVWILNFANKFGKMYNHLKDFLKKFKCSKISTSFQSVSAHVMVVLYQDLLIWRGQSSKLNKVAKIYLYYCKGSSWNTSSSVLKYFSQSRLKMQKVLYV